MALVAVGALGFTCAACTLLLPERMAVNAPIMNSLFGWGGDPVADAELRERIQLPEGFRIGRYAVVPRARFLRATPNGHLLVSVPREGRVVLLERDADGDGLPDGQRVLLDELNRPHGLDVHDGWLYVAETDTVSRVRFDSERGELDGELERVLEIPGGGGHWTRTVRVGPDGFLYVSLGSTCNVCLEEDERRATMLRARPDGSEAAIFARGLRNAVGFDWQPDTGRLYATDNGRDLLGDDFPPCELNHVVEGADYGWPVVNGFGVLDPDFGEGNEGRARAATQPVHGFRAHTAPLGIHFLRGDAWPEGYRGAAVVALHGSWNRTKKDGYKVVSLHFSEDGRIQERDFVWGFLEDEDVIGRPVDVERGPDGSLFVSDDYAGMVYRVVYGDEVANAPAGSADGGADPLALVPATERAAAAERGKALYEDHKCFVCHDSGRHEPNLEPVVLKSLGAKHSLTDLEALIQTPTPPMPAYPFDAAQRRDLAVFLLAEFG